MTVYFSKTTLGFYDTAVAAYALPSDAVEITQATWNSLLQSQCDGMVITADANGNPIAVLPASLLTVAQAQAQQLKVINAACDAALDTLTTAYPSNEVLSWDQQVAESQAYTASNTAATPLLSAIAAASNTTVATLAAAVIAKSNAYKAQVGALIGQRQALAAQINTPGITVAAVQEIVWPNS